MNERDVQEMLKNLFETLLDARDEVEGEDDDITLAEFLRDMVDESQGVVKATGFDEAMLLTSNQGLVLRTEDGREFQISIVQSR